MKYLMAIFILVVGTSSLATCPDLTGTYLYTSYNGQTSKSEISTRFEGGTAIYRYLSAAQIDYIADGKHHKQPDSSMMGIDYKSVNYVRICTPKGFITHESFEQYDAKTKELKISIYRTVDTTYDPQTTTVTHKAQGTILYADGSTKNYSVEEHAVKQW